MLIDYVRAWDRLPGRDPTFTPQARPAYRYECRALPDKLIWRPACADSGCADSYERRKRDGFGETESSRVTDRRHIRAFAQSAAGR